MSAENIFSNYPPDEVYSRFIASEAERKGIDPIVHSAHELVRAGRDSLLSRNNEFDDLYEELSPEEMKDLVVSRTQDEWNAIMLGHLIGELHTTMKTGRFSVGSFVGKFNFSITGSLLPNMKMPEDFGETIEIDHDELAGIRSVHSGDRTFAKMFRRPESLPKEIERFFNDELDLFNSQSFQNILNLWEQRARLLASYPVARTKALQKTEPDSNPMAGFTHEQIAKYEKLREKFQDGQLD